MPKKKIRVLHVTTSLKIGGAEAVLCDLLSHLSSQQFEHHVIYFYEGPHVAHIKKLGIPVYKVSGFFCLYDPVFFVRLFRLVRSLRPDVIHSLLWSANICSRIVSWLLAIPSVSAYHLDIYKDGLLRNFLDGITKKMSERIIAVAPDVAKSVDSFGASRSIQIIENGIDFDQVCRKNISERVSRSALGLLDSHFVIGSVGRLHQQKNFSLLLKSFSLLCQVEPHVRLVIVGFGVLEMELKEEARALGVVDKVIFVIGEPAYRYYGLFDCFVQSSYHEGLSIALLEAMSFAIPCIVTSIGCAHPVIASGKNGLVVTVLDRQLLSHAMLSFMRDAHTANCLGLQGKQTVEKSFSVDRMAKSYALLFCEFSNRQ